MSERWCGSNMGPTADWDGNSLGTDTPLTVINKNTLHSW